MKPRLAWKVHDPRPVIAPLLASIVCSVIVAVLANTPAKSVPSWLGGPLAALLFLAVVLGPFCLWLFVAASYSEWREHRSVPGLFMFAATVGSWLWFAGIALVVSPGGAVAAGLMGALVGCVLGSMGSEKVGHFFRWERRDRSGRVIYASPWHLTGTSAAPVNWTGIREMSCSWAAMGMAALGAFLIWGT
ncbi:MAG: hypothetical protein HOP16_09785 [Acidobacteria bacterium]|nr:hypothetical protein [Acidobacteriota bacterium]